MSVTLTVLGDGVLVDGLVGCSVDDIGFELVDGRLLGACEFGTVGFPLVAGLVVPFVEGRELEVVGTEVGVPGCWLGITGVPEVDCGV